MPRLYHKKSRTGCKLCRDRRVKCDEVHPSCGSCSRHQLQCLYDRGHFVQPIRILPASAEPANGESTAVIPVETRERRLMELGLLQIFITEVCPLLPNTVSEAIRRIWTIEVPKLALGYNPLLNIIMVLTLRFMESSRSDYRDLRLTHSSATLRARYVEEALEEFNRPSLGGHVRTLAESKCFTSVLLSYEAFSYLRERCLVPYSPPLEWLDRCKNIMGILRSNLGIVRHGSQALLRQAIEISTPLIEPSFIFCEENRNKFPYLLYRSEIDPESDMDHEAYMNTVCYIGAIMKDIENGESVMFLSGKILVFPILMSSRYLHMLCELKPRALVILAHYFAVASYCRNLWLIGGVPAREIRAIATYLGIQWQESMAWPMRTLQPL
ncbi:C6 transcription factor, partial [Trichoderma ceciliae]